MRVQETQGAEEGVGGFVLRIAPGGIDRVERALECNELLIGWSEAGGLLDEKLDWWGFREIIHQTYHASEANYQKSGRGAGNMWRFIRKMDTGDLVVVPHGPAFYVGEVTGPAIYAREAIGEDTAYRRPVRWLNGRRPIPRRHARAALVARMKVLMTCAAAADLVDDIRDALRLAQQGKEPSFTEDLRSQLIDATKAEILTGRMSERSFEELIADLLRVRGAARVRIVPRKLDQGADIIAVFNIAGASSVVLAVQAKYYRPEPPVGVQAVDALLRGMAAEGADLGWVVTSGTTGEEVAAYAQRLHEEEGVRVELIDGEQLAAMIVEAGVKPSKQPGA